MIARQSVAEQLVGDMGVDFRGAHAGVAQHLLYGKQVGAAFKQMGGEAVTEGMRADGFGEAVALGQVLDDKEDHLTCEARASTVQKDRIGEFGLRCDV